jgi:hypothetical protein
MGREFKSPPSFVAAGCVAKSCTCALGLGAFYRRCRKAATCRSRSVGDECRLCRAAMGECYKGIPLLWAPWQIKEMRLTKPNGAG